MALPPATPSTAQRSSRQAAQPSASFAYSVGNSARAGSPLPPAATDARAVSPRSDKNVTGVRVEDSQRQCCFAVLCRWRRSASVWVGRAQATASCPALGAAVSFAPRERAGSRLQQLLMLALLLMLMLMLLS